MKTKTNQSQGNRYKVECLNKEKGITSSLKVSHDTKEYVVCLCLSSKTIINSFPNEQMAYEQMKKYRALYKEFKKL